MEIKRYISLLLHWWWVIALALIITSGTAYLISINTTPTYSSAARLMVDEAPGSESYGEVLRIEKLKATYVELLTFQPVMDRTAVTLAKDHGIALSGSQLSGRVSAASAVDTQLITVGVEDTDPERAAIIANTVAREFIAYLEEQQGERFNETLTLYDTEQANVGQEIEALEAQINVIAQTPEDSRTAEEVAELSLLQAQLNEQQNTYNTIFNNSQALRVQAATSTTDVIVVDQAVSNPNQIRPRTLNNTLLAAVVGVLLAIGVILLFDYLNDTIRTPNELQEVTGRDALGVIPFIQTNDTRENTLVTYTKPRDPTSEAFRILRTNLEFMSIDKELQRLVITSPSPSEGKSTTIANLATVLAQAGKQVILIDADLRKPSQHKIFNTTTNSQGLTTALLDNETPLSAHIQETPVPGLSVMTSGPLPPNPAELLGSNRMDQILDELNKDADVVLIDTPPTLMVADASIITTKADGVMVVARIGETRQEALTKALTTLTNTGQRLFGVVLNRATAGDGGYYYNYYYYRYAYDYGDTRQRKTSRGRRWMPQWLTSIMR